MSTIDANGLVIDRFDTVKTELENDLKAAFGEGLKLTPDSVWGQFVSILAERISDQNELIEVTANLFNPAGAPGVFLSQLVQLNGIDRNESVFSTVALNVTANSAGSTIPAGSTVSDPAIGEKFAIDSTVVLTPGQIKSVSATAVNAGLIEAPSGTLTKIDTPVYGWASVTNPADASPGASEETDQELRIRRDIAARAAGTANEAAIFTALSEVDGVDLVAVYSNRTNSADSRGVPAHSVWAVVRGGTDADIAQTLFEKTAAGAGWYGSTTVAYSDPTTGETYNVKFSRPTEVTIYVTYVLEKYTTYPTNGDDLIVENVVDFFNGDFYLDGNLVQPFGLDDDVIASRLYTPANVVPGHRIIGVLIGTSASPTESDNISIGPDQLAGTEADKIVVTVS